MVAGDQLTRHAPDRLTSRSVVRIVIAPMPGSCSRSVTGTEARAPLTFIRPAAV